MPKGKRTAIGATVTTRAEFTDWNGKPSVRLDLTSAAGPLHVYVGPDHRLASSVPHRTLRITSGVGRGGRILHRERTRGWDGARCTRLDLDDNVHLYAEGNHPLGRLKPGARLAIC